MKAVSQHLSEALTRLSSQRPIFHSEADFAMALGSELQKIESVEIRMEKPVNVKYFWKENLEVVSTAYLDMFVITPNEKVAIELKYRTKKFEGVVKDEMFKLKHHNARDVGRYHFRQDIYRVEHLVKSKQATGGIALLLTNDNRFWEDDVDTITMDGKFRIGSGLIPKTAEWQWGNDYLSHNHKLVDGIWVSKTKDKPNWTYGKEYTKILTLERDYKAEWELYSLVENKEFKHLMVVV